MGKNLIFFEMSDLWKITELKPFFAAMQANKILPGKSLVFVSSGRYNHFLLILFMLRFIEKLIY